MTYVDHEGLPHFIKRTLQPLPIVMLSLGVGTNVMGLDHGVSTSTYVKYNKN